MIRISGSVGLFSSWMMIERVHRIERADRIEGKDPRLWLGLRAFVHI